MQWSTLQNQVLRDHAAEGADACVEALRRELNVERSLASVRMHASRAGISLAVRFVCPACGHEGGPHDFRFGDGLCEACHLRRKSHELDARNAVLEREYQRRLADANRENARLRQRSHRLRERLAKLEINVTEKVNSQVSDEKN